MKAKLVAESLQEYAKFGNDNNNELNEGFKDNLKLYLKDPEKNEEEFVNGFEKTDATLLKKAAKLDKETKIRLAKEAVAKMDKDPKAAYPKIFYDAKAKKIWGGAIASKGNVTSINR